MTKLTHTNILIRTQELIREGILGEFNRETAYDLQEDLQKFFGQEAIDMAYLPHGVVVTQNVKNLIDKLLAEGQRIKAIKALREANNLSLKLAKECLDAYDNRHQPNTEPDFSDISKPGHGILIVTYEVLKGMEWYINPNTPEVYTKKYNIINEDGMLISSFYTVSEVREEYLRLLNDEPKLQGTRDGC